MRNKVITSVVGAIAATILIASPALACHPVGTIVKSVENQTTGSGFSDANTARTAVAAKPGDTLVYQVVIGNDGQSDSYNAMEDTVLTDNLPNGVELVSNPSQRTITDNIGTVQPGGKVTEQYAVKVTASQSGQIVNTACFTANNTQNASLPKTCDVAIVNVTVPTPIVTASAPITPSTPAPVVVAQPAPTALVNTGPGSFIPALVLTIVGGYLAALLYKKSRLNKAL